MKTFFLFLLVGCVVAPGALAFDVPPTGQYVNDTAGIIDDSATQQLSLALDEIYKKGGPQVAVLTVKSLDGMAIEDAAFNVFKKWGIGADKKDNGVLLMVAVKDKRVRIEVGQGLEGDLTDAYSRRIIDERIVPMFRQGHYSDGILLGLDGILTRMNPPIHLDDYMNVRHRSQPENIDWPQILIMLFIFIIIMSSRSGRSGLLGFLLGSTLGGGGGRYGGGGGGWGGGGFGGGGGSSSGGGASGSW